MATLLNLKSPSLWGASSNTFLFVLSEQGLQNHLISSVSAILERKDNWRLVQYPMFCTSKKHDDISSTSLVITVIYVYYVSYMCMCAKRYTHIIYRIIHPHGGVTPRCGPVAVVVVVVHHQHCIHIILIRTIHVITLPKFTIEPGNDGFQKESPIPGADFQVPS